MQRAQELLYVAMNCTHMCLAATFISHANGPGHY